MSDAAQRIRERLWAEHTSGRERVRPIARVLGLRPRARGLDIVPYLPECATPIVWTARQLLDSSVLLAAVRWDTTTAEPS